MRQSEHESNAVPEWFMSEVLRLFSLYPGAHVTKVTVPAWWSVLRGISADDLQRGFLEAARRSRQFCPSAFAVEEAAQNKGQSAEEKAAAAWPEVRNLATRSRSDHNDPIAREAIRLMGGGKRLGQMSQDELDVWGRKQFVERYQEAAEKQRRDERLGLTAHQPVLELPSHA